MAALRDGVITRHKAEIIVRVTSNLEPDQARAAEARVLDRAGRLTPGGLRAAIIRAVMEVAPEKARKRREEARKDARVERWPEDSGNAALAGFELPPDEVLAADQRITWWAGELKKAGLEGDMDVLRARAYLDLLLGEDSRPTASPGTASGFAGRATLTVPLATLLDLADRPGEIGGIGPVDPWLARDLAGAAARNPKTTWCVTVTDQHGHAIGHGCARPGPAGRGKPEGRAPPGFAFTVPAEMGRRAGTARGRYAPRDRARTSPSPWTRSPPTRASTGTRPRGTTPASGCGTWPRSGTPRAPRRCADGPRPPATSSTTRRMRRAG
jgi:hypothetical protein